MELHSTLQLSGNSALHFPASCSGSGLKENARLLSSSQAFVSSSWKKNLITMRRLTKKCQLVAAAHPRCAAGHGSSNGDQSQREPELSSLDRRQLLLASSLGIAGLPLLSSQAALASPVQPPDLKQCTTPIDPGNGAPTVDCCLPVLTTISDFKLPTNLPLRTRVSAHQVSQDYIAKYNKAYQLLRQLPASDPRQYSQQANVHCAFCDGAYDEKGTQIEYQVHHSWLFFPWHRWYLYFHERILASLINDDSFALPFWNWDAASGYTIPPIYTSRQSPLYDSNRNPAHQPPTVVDLNYNFTESNLSPSAQLAANNALMYRQMVTNAKTPSLFFGQAYRQGDAASPGAGTIENVPHGTVHIWTGNPANPNDEDMGTLYSAGRDPIFFAHHSNIDRLWEVWKSFGGRRKDIIDKDYLDATFLFYDENAKLVRVRIGDALDTTNLAYKYQDVPNAWLNAAPRSRTSSASAVSFGPGGAPPAAMAGIRQKIKEGLKEFKERSSKKLEKVVSSLVKRPKKVRADDFEEEILVFEGVEIPADEKVKVDVYINLPDADEEAGCEISEFAGSFFNVPHLGMKMGEGKRVRKSNFRLGIGEVLKELGVEDDDSFSITLVQRGQTSIPISIDSVKLEYE